MSLIKHLPEDFIVEEMSILPELKPGPYHYLYLKKRTFTTLKACQVIADAFYLPVSAISFAGNKDKMAVTKQLISIKTPKNITKLVERFKIGDITLEYLGSGTVPVALGELNGNRFTIIVRKITHAPQPRERFVNYFGEQRFSKNNTVIGKHLLKKEFAHALALITKSENDSPNVANPVAQLKKIPKSLLKMYVHAYQSLFFNRAVEEFLKNKKREDMQNQPIPLIGFGYEPSGTEIDAILQKILADECITPRDFIIRAFPEISSEGGERQLFAEIHDLQVGRLEDDDIHPSFKKCTLTFWLDKGCYATGAVKQLFIQ